MVLVGDDVVLFIGLDAGDAEIQFVEFGDTADGPKNGIEVFQNTLTVLILVVQTLGLAVGRLFQLGLAGVLVDDDALLLVLLGNGVLDHGVKCAEELVLADEEVSLGSQGVEHAGHLNGNVAGAHDGDLLGQRLHVEETVTVDSKIFTLNADGGRATSDCDQDLLGLYFLRGAIVGDDLDSVGVDERGGAVNVFDLVILQVLLVDAIQTLDVGVALVLEGGEIKGGRLADREAVCLGLLDGFGNGCGVVCHLFGDASGGMA